MDIDTRMVELMQELLKLAKEKNPDTNHISCYAIEYDDEIHISVDGWEDPPTEFEDTMEAVKTMDVYERIEK